MLMCRPHVVAANRCRGGPAARCSAYRLSPAFSRSRESNTPTPCSPRNSIHSLTACAYTFHVAGDGAPLAGSSRSHWFTSANGRGAPGPSSNRRSSSTRTGIRSGMSGRFTMSQDSQPRDEKKLMIMSRNDRNTTLPAAAGNHSSHGAPGLIATRELSRENPAEIVRGEHERVAGGIGQAGRGERVYEQLADRAGGERPVLAADGPLEQQRHGRVPDPFPDVVGDGQRDGPAGTAEPADDRRQDIGKFGADQEQSLRIGLARGDLQQRDELAGRRQPVLGDAVVGELQEFLAADPGQPQHLDRGEAPERFFFLI